MPDNNQIKEIVLIAPYEKMLLDAQNIIKENNWDNAMAVLGDLSDGLIVASKVVNEGTKVLISRGGTHSLIRYVSPVPVIEIKISVLDIIDTLKAILPINGKIAVIGYSMFMEGFNLLKEFGKTTIQVELNRKDNVEEKIKECRKEGVKAIIGDAVTCRIGKKLGFDCYLMESGKESLRNAFDEAYRILGAIKREQELLNRYRTLADSVHDAVLATNEDDVIVAVNRPAYKIFGLSKAKMLGQKIGALRTFGAIIDELKEHKPLQDELRQIGAAKVEISNYPIIMDDGKTRGSIAVFQDIAEMQNREKNIRLKLLEKGFTAKYSFDMIVHKSQRIDECINIAKKISNYDSAVLVEGASGVGKELFVQSIHNASERRCAPFIAVNCAALPPSLIESTLFGYADGAFTGGSKGGKEGVFELAHTGTLFLDEIGELPLELQGRLLRVVQEHEIMRVGGDANIPLDVRLICATNRDLNQLVTEGKFRGDLLYRINTLRLYIPALNERPEDIPLLAETFLRRFAAQYSKAISGFTSETIDFLKCYVYNGNVRELQSMVERAVIICESSLVTVHDLQVGLREKSICVGNKQESSLSPNYNNRSLKETEKDYIHRVYEECGYSTSDACAVLGINRSTLWRKLKQ